MTLLVHLFIYSGSSSSPSSADTYTLCGSLQSLHNHSFCFFPYICITFPSSCSHLQLSLLPFGFTFKTIFMILLSLTLNMSMPTYSAIFLFIFPSLTSPKFSNSHSLSGMFLLNTITSQKLSTDLFLSPPIINPFICIP